MNPSEIAHSQSQCDSYFHFTFKPGARKALISAFIVFNVVAIGFGSSQPISQQNAVQKFFLPYLRWTRLLQNWPLFVPTPRKFAMKYRVDIVFRDGTSTVWRRPYPPNWDFFERHLAYSFQKWDLASNYLEQRGGPVSRDLATYIEHLYWSDTNPPATITLVKETAPWPPPNETGYVGGDDSQLRWTDHPMFVYHVTEKRMDWETSH